MSDYEPSAAEIDAALESWFSDARLGWKANPDFANRAFWRQTMRDALVAANAVRITVLPGSTICADTVGRIAPTPVVRASDGDRELTMIRGHAAADHEHPQHQEPAFATMG
jgi:hypothetical protein